MPILFNRITKYVMKNSKVLYLFPLISATCSPVFAHQKTALFAESSIKILAAATYRNNQIVENGQTWQPNGFLIGGEAVPATKGASLDDAQLQGYLNVNNQYYVAAKLGSHSHGGESSFELENLWFGTELNVAEQRFSVEAGKMATEVTDTLNYHASANVFSQAPLSADILFGRHFNDIGVRVANLGSNYTLGLELFNGDNFPASSGEGSVSLFSHFNFQHIIPARSSNAKHNVTATAKLWLMYSEAEQRADDRYSDGHSHGLITATTTESYFTGDTLNVGAYFDARWAYNDWAISGEFEWIQAQINGQVQTTTQNALMESTQNAYRITTSMFKNQHSLHLEYEILSAQNQFSQTTVTLLEQIGLHNNGFEPSRTSIAWHYAFHPDFVLRTEWVKDESNELLEENTIFSLGIQWQYNLL